jgi:hypothetical protein
MYRFTRDLDTVHKPAEVIVKLEDVDVTDGMVGLDRELPHLAGHGQQLPAIGPVHAVTLKASI